MTYYDVLAMFDLARKVDAIAERANARLGHVVTYWLTQFNEMPSEYAIRHLSDEARSWALEARMLGREAGAAFDAVKAAEALAKAA